MKGTIKFVNQQEGWGFITPDDGSRDLHLEIGKFIGPCPRKDAAGRPVEFQSYRDSKGVHAGHIRLLDSEETDLPPWANPSALGKALTKWATLPRPFYEPYPPKESFPSALHRLDGITLEEPWHFGSEPPPEDEPYPILWNYLSFTFVRHCKQDVLHEFPPEQANLRVSPDGKWATFNTGLVNQLYDPVFALFRKDRGEGPPWVLFDFCVPGQGRAGVDLANAFNPLPEPPKYFKNTLDMLLDPEQPITIDERHAIIDSIARDRYPYEFLRQNLGSRPPKGIAWEDYSGYKIERRLAYLKTLSLAIKEDAQARRSIKNRLEDAKDLAVKRTKWNYKTAIPQYYPREDEMSLLLPMCLVNDEVVDIALVVSQLDSGAYQGSTVFPLKWAYKNARLVCRPDSDWLKPDLIGMEGSEEEQTEGNDREPARNSPVSEKGDIEHAVDEPQEDSWAQFARAHEVGDMVEGTVQNLVNYGAFVDFAEGVTGLLHVSNISDEHVQDPADRLNVGEPITVQILKIDERARKIELSMRGMGKEGAPDDPAKDSLVECQQGNTEHAFDESQEDSWAQFTRTHEVGDVVDGTVRNLAPYGAFVDLAEEITGLIHISKIRDGYVEDIRDELSVGQQIRPRILQIDKSARKIGLSLCDFKRTEDDIDQ